MTIKLPVRADGNFIVDADELPVAVAIQNHENGELDLSTAYARAQVIANALNATATTPDLTATVNRILNALHHQGLTTWGCLSIEDAEACRAEAFIAVMDILKVGTP